MFHRQNNTKFILILVQSSLLTIFFTLSNKCVYLFQGIIFLKSHIDICTIQQIKIFLLLILIKNIY